MRQLEQELPDSWWMAGKLQGSWRRSPRARTPSPGRRRDRHRDRRAGPDDRGARGLPGGRCGAGSRSPAPTAWSAGGRSRVSASRSIPAPAGVMGSVRMPSSRSAIFNQRDWQDSETKAPRRLHDRLIALAGDRDHVTSELHRQRLGHGVDPPSEADGLTIRSQPNPGQSHRGAGWDAGPTRTRTARIRGSSARVRPPDERYLESIKGSWALGGCCSRIASVPTRSGRAGIPYAALVSCSKAPVTAGRGYSSLPR